MLRKNRIKKLEGISKSKKWIPPKMVYENKDGGWTTPTGVKLIEDGERFLYEDGRIYYEPLEEYSHLVGPIRITYV